VPPPAREAGGDIFRDASTECGAIVSTGRRSVRSARAESIGGALTRPGSAST